MEPYVVLQIPTAGQRIKAKKCCGPQWTTATFIFYDWASLSGKTFSPQCLSFPFTFFLRKVIANLKGTVDKAMGSMYTGNYWQLELDSQRNSWNNPKQIKVKVLLLHRVEAKERVYLSGESNRYSMTCRGKFTQKWELLLAISQLHSGRVYNYFWKWIETMNLWVHFIVTV